MDDRTTIQLSESLRKELRLLAASRDKNYQELLKDMIEIFKELNPNKTIISIPTRLSEKIKQKITNTDIESVSEYITFITRLALSEDSQTAEENQIKNRLKKLGYL